MSEWRVILVDDEEEFVLTLAERLQMRGLKAEAFTDAEAALSVIMEKKPEVVVLDVMMPGLSGLNLLRSIKSSAPNVQVILLTGRGSTQEGIEGMRLGAFDYMMKPVDIDELIGKMKSAAMVAGQDVC